MRLVLGFDSLLAREGTHWRRGCQHQNQCGGEGRREKGEGGGGKKKGGKTSGGGVKHQPVKL